MRSGFPADRVQRGAALVEGRRAQPGRAARVGRRDQHCRPGSTARSSMRRAKSRWHRPTTRSSRPAPARPRTSAPDPVRASARSCVRCRRRRTRRAGLRPPGRTPPDRPARRGRPARYWAWVIASPSSRRAHSANRLRCLPLAVTAARTSATTNCECPVSDSAARTTSATSSGSPSAISQVEVGGQRVADIGLHQRLQPGARHRQPVVVLQRRHVLRHRRHDVDATAFQGIAQQLVVAHLGGGHAGHRDPSAQVRRHPRLVGQPVERSHLAVGQHREQFVDAGMIRRQSWTTANRPTRSAEEAEVMGIDSSRRTLEDAWASAARPAMMRAR